MNELFRVIRDDIVNKMYKNNVHISDIAFDLDMDFDEILKYLKLEKTDYLVYKNMYESIENN